MQIQPTQNFLACQLIDTAGDGSILIPEDANPVQPHALVLKAGPDCKFVQPTNRVLFLPQNMMAMYGPSADKTFFLPETAVYAFYLGEETQILEA